MIQNIFGRPLKMKKQIVVAILLISSFSFAAQLEDVKILNIKPGTENFELKLQAKEGSSDSYFYVDILKSDKDSYDKLVHVIKKITRREQYKLNLEIPSFSLTPSGSYYRGDSVLFSSSSDREPNAVTPVKKKKNK